MNITRHEHQMPSIKLTREELEAVIYKVLSNYHSSLDFNGFLNVLSNELLSKGGFNTEQNTTYSGQLQQKDKGLIREVIWDLVIMRYLSPGGNGHDEWPSLTITSKGLDFFASHK